MAVLDLRAVVVLVWKGVPREPARRADAARRRSGAGVCRDTATATQPDRRRGHAAIRLGTNAYRAQFGDRYVGVPKDQAEIWIRQGVKVLGITAAYDDYLTQTLVTEGPDQFDEPEPPSP